MTLRRLAGCLGIKMKVDHVHENPNMSDFEGDHWKVVLRRANRATMSFYYSKGYGHNGAEPKLAEVMELLQMDSYCCDTFEEFCSEYGYDADSRSVERTFKLCRRFAAKIKKFFGTDLELLRRAD